MKNSTHSGQATGDFAQQVADSCSTKKNPDMPPERRALNIFDGDEGKEYYNCVFEGLGVNPATANCTEVKEQFNGYCDNSGVTPDIDWDIESSFCPVDPNKAEKACDDLQHISNGNNAPHNNVNPAAIGAAMFAVGLAALVGRKKIAGAVKGFADRMQKPANSFAEDAASRENAGLELV